MKKLFSLLLALLLVITLALPAYATTTKSAGPGSVNITGKTSITITPAMTTYTSTDLFGGDFKGVMPGDTKYETVTIKNWAAQYDYVKVYMQAKQHPKEELVIANRGVTVQVKYDFLSQLYLTVTKGKTLIYEAGPDKTYQLDEAGKLSDPVYLGKLSRLQSITLDVELVVPITLGNAYADSIGEVDWVFYFEGYNNSDTPKTGDYIMAAVIVMAVSAAALVLLLVIKRRKNRK